MSSECPDSAAPGGGPDALSSMPAGVVLAQSLAEIDPAEVRSDFDLLGVIAGWERVVACAQAQQLAAVAEFARRPVVIGPDPQAGWAARAGRGEVVRPSPTTRSPPDWRSRGSPLRPASTSPPVWPVRSPAPATRCRPARST